MDYDSFVHFMYLELGLFRDDFLKASAELTGIGERDEDSVLVMHESLT